MAEKKTINIDQNYLKISSSKKKEKKERNNFEKNTQVKPQSVKELLLKKLKEYKKQKKKQANKSQSFIPTNSVISDSFMETIQKKKNKTEQSIHVDTMHENNTLPPEHNTLPPEHNNTMVETTTISTVPSISSQPQYSNLKNSTLPTYRQWKNKTQKSTHTNPVKSKKINISKKMIVGLNKTKKKVGIFLKNSKLKQKIDDNIIEMKQCKLKTVKSYLKKKNLIRYGSSAPTDLLREMYISSNLCGGINNTNGSNIIENFYETT